MTAGVVLFAYNNDQIDYVKLAEWSAERINRYLDLPVTLVTDHPNTSRVFDRVIDTATPASSGRYFDDYQQVVEWKNGNRSDAFALSPYDTTLVLDVDYIVGCSDLTQLTQTNLEFASPTTAYDVTGVNDFSSLNVFGKFKMPMTWATILFFRKTKTTEMIFETVQMVRQHWKHYCNLYQISKSNFRNDFAFAIALNLVYGHQARWPVVPWKLASINPEHTLTQINETKFQVRYVTAAGKPRYIELSNMDFHAMGKRSLGDIIANTQ